MPSSRNTVQGPGFKIRHADGNATHEVCGPTFPEHALATLITCRPGLLQHWSQYPTSLYEVMVADETCWHGAIEIILTHRRSSNRILRTTCADHALSRRSLSATIIHCRRGPCWRKAPHPQPNSPSAPLPPTFRMCLVSQCAPNGRRPPYSCAYPGRWSFETSSGRGPVAPHSCPTSISRHWR